MSFMCRRLGLLAVVTGVLATAAPVASASALPLIGFPGGLAIGGNEIGAADCVGTNRPSGGGNAGSTSNQTCGPTQAFNGPSVGSWAHVVGPTISGATIAAPVVSSAGSPVVTFP